ncbi:MAG: thiamine diphosphokinase [Anaerolineae bacterium]|nr:thiamine diphosphokinase [Anaerolineae bacterium]
MKALIFANGAIEDGEMVQRALAQSGDALIIAADGGARIAAHYGRKVDAVIGDMDSLAPDELAALRAQNATIVAHPAEKDETDLELALMWAVEQGADWLRVIGATGGRLDQAISNIYLLALPVLDGCDVKLVAGNQATWLARAGRTEIAGAVGDTVSLIPLNGTVHGVATDALYYRLNDEDLYFGPARGVSNVMMTEQAAVTVRAGVLLVVHTIGRA